MLIQQRFGWHFLASEISKFTLESFFTIMDKPALEIAGIAAIIAAKSIYNNG